MGERRTRSNGRSGMQVAADLPVVKHLGNVANAIAGRLQCELSEMACHTSGPLILLDVPGAAIKAVKGIGDIHARGHTPKKVQQDVHRLVNLHLEAVSATG